MRKNRSLHDLIVARFQESHPLIQVVVGPRQVGKTTAVQSALRGRGIYETADSPLPLPASVIAEWWARAAAQPDRILAIDEIQKIPGWSEVLKRLWDTTTPPLKVIVTGSSALLVEPLSPARFGHYFENAVGARFIEAGWDTFYWSERDKEIDFVVLGPNGEKRAVEVKTTDVEERGLKTLHSFCRLYPEFEPCLVSLSWPGIAGIRNLVPEDLLSLTRTIGTSGQPLWREQESEEQASPQ
jgi:predicted AAA+ superfamily ATPase